MASAATATWPLPDIDPARIVPFDFFAVEPVDGDLHAGWKRWQDRFPDPFYTPLNGGHWVVTRADQIAEIFRDYDRFSASGIALFREPSEGRFLPGELDPPLHRDFRIHLDPEISPKRLRPFAETARALTAELIDAIAPLGACRFQASVGHIMPIWNFLVYMGLPREDADFLLPNIENISRASSEAVFAGALQAVAGYIEDRLNERLEAPRDDFLTRLLNARIGERAITPHEVRATAMNVLNGGLDTVTSSMGFFMKYLAEHPEQRRRLADNPVMIPNAVEELLRRHGIFNTARLAVADLDFHGTPFRERDLVMIPTALYNLDERRFPDPLAVDFDRPDKAHYTFAGGIHRCLGQNFARMQLHMLLEEWLKRIPDFAIDPEGEVILQSGRANAVIELPLVWNRRGG